MRLKFLLNHTLFGMLILLSKLVSAGTEGVTANHPLNQGQWNLSANGGISDTRFISPSTVLRFSGTDINGNPNPTGVLGKGKDYFFNKLFGTHYFYAVAINYAYTNNLEWGIEFEGTYADGQRYRRQTPAGFFDQTYASYQSYSAYLTSTYYFDKYFEFFQKAIHPFVGAKLGYSYRPDVMVSKDFLNGVPVMFDGKSNAVFYKASSSLSGGLYAGMMMPVQERFAAFIKVSIMASDGLLGNNLFDKTVAIRPIRQASVSNTEAIISYPVVIGVKMFLG